MERFHMDIKQLKVFLKVCELGSFTSAAKALNYAQSSVSEIIKGLEADLKCPLFERIGKRIFLTEKGKLLKTQAIDMVRIHETTLEMMGTDSPKTLKVGITESLCNYKFPAFFRTFLESEPHLSIEFTIARCEEIFQLVLDHQIDLGFTLDDQIHDSSIESLVLFEEAIVFVKGAHTNMPSSVYELAGEKYLLPKGTTGYNRIFNDFFAKEEIALGSSIMMESIEGIKSYVRQGFGFSFMPYATVANEIDTEQMIEISTGNEHFVQYCQILIHKDKHRSNVLAHLIEFAKAHYQS